MKLQLALDEMKTEEAIKLVEKVKDYIDIIEVGTPICLDAGNRWRNDCDVRGHSGGHQEWYDVLQDCRWRNKYYGFANQVWYF